MRGFILLFTNLFLVFQISADTFVSVPNLTAFTHLKFFYNDCKCGMFNPTYFQLEIYKTPTEFTNIPYNSGSSWIIPPNFEVGYSVIITGKQGDFFRIKFDEEEHPLCYQCNDSSYYVKKGTLGTWVYNYNDSIDDFVSVPLYEKPCVNSKIITKINFLITSYFFLFSIISSL